MRPNPYIPKHLYLLKDLSDEYLFRYIRRGEGGSGKKKYIFQKVAYNGPMNFDSRFDVFRSEDTPLYNLIPVPFEDLPIYMGFKCQYPVFEEIIKRGHL